MGGGSSSFYLKIGFLRSNVEKVFFSLSSCDISSNSLLCMDGSSSDVKEVDVHLGTKIIVMLVPILQKNS